MGPAALLGFAFPVDTSLAVLRLIGAGLFDRNPVIVAAHLGGVLTWLRERLGIYGQTGPLFPSPSRLARPVADYLDQLYVDTVGYGPRPLEYCYAQLGADRLLFGTDHPYGAPAFPGSSSIACRARRPNASRSWPATRDGCCGSASRWQNLPEGYNPGAAVHRRTACRSHQIVVVRATMRARAGRHDDRVARHR
jgi:hypothetical protein